MGSKNEKEVLRLRSNEKGTLLYEVDKDPNESVTLK